MISLFRVTRPAVAALALLASVSGCAFMHRDYPHGHRGPKYLDARQPSDLGTTGIESADIQTACGNAVSKLLAQPLLANTQRPPRFSVQCSDFHADLSSDFDTSA